MNASDASRPAKVRAGSAVAGSPLTARGARTRAVLVKAARALFERQGYIETSVGDISKRAQVAHGTFYTYFNSKEEIFSEVADELQRDLLLAAEAEPHLPPGSPISARIERANRGYLRGYAEHARMMGVLEQVATFNPRLAAIRRSSRRYYVQRSTTSIRRWQEQGLVDPRIDADYASSALGSMIDRSAYVWLVLGEPFDLDRAVEQLTRLYCNALGLPYHRDAVDTVDVVDAVDAGRPPKRRKPS